MRKFTKMHGAGNDFVVIDARQSEFSAEPETLTLIADRHRGVGCDQILVLSPAANPGSTASYHVYNADGGKAGQCGNGVRCLARYLKPDTEAAELVLDGPNGPVSTRIEGNDVAVDMGAPIFEPAAVPFEATEDSDRYSIEIESKTFEIGVVSFGNPHAVVGVEDVDTAAVDEIGIVLSRHSRFPAGANVGFMQVVSPNRIRLRVYERGVGETLACGTGACAAVAIGRRLGLLGDRVEVDLPGGRLVVSSDPGTFWLTGPAIRVFEGQYNL